MLFNFWICFLLFLTNKTVLSNKAGHNSSHVTSENPEFRECKGSAQISTTCWWQSQGCRGNPRLLLLSSLCHGLLLLTNDLIKVVQVPFASNNVDADCSGQPSGTAHYRWYQGPRFMLKMAREHRLQPTEVATGQRDFLLSDSFLLEGRRAGRAHSLPAPFSKACVSRACSPQMLLFSVVNVASNTAGSKLWRKLWTQS